jgi:putative hydrolase of the HAD superfamily
MTAPLVVLFDLDDTIMAHREAVEAGILLHMRRRGYEGDVAAAQRRWYELEEQHYHDYLAGRLSFEGQRRARASAFAESFGEALGDAEASAWFAEYFESYRASWSMHGDALPMLEHLTELVPDVRLGIITNGELDYQQTKLERLGLAGRFEHVVASGSVGVTKPDVAIFEAALARFDGTPPERAVYVGDRLRTDAIGAAQAGLLGVWLNRRGDRAEAGDAEEATALGVREIGGLEEFVPIVTERHRGIR